MTLQASRRVATGTHLSFFRRFDGGGDACHGFPLSNVPKTERFPLVVTSASLLVTSALLSSNKRIAF